MKMEQMLKQLLEMMQDLKKGQEDIETKMITKEDMKKFLQDMKNDLKNSQETIKAELKTEVEEKVQVIEEKVYISEETATSQRNEAEKDVKRIESEPEDIHEELKVKNEGTDSAKSNGTIDSNVDTTTNNAEHKPESNESAKEGETSGSVAAGSSSEVPENEEETTNLQLVWEVLELNEKVYQERGEESEKSLAKALVNFGGVSLENGHFESAISDIKEGLGMRDEIAALTVEGQQGQDQTKKWRRSQEGPDAIVTELNDGVWRIPKRPRVKMKFVRLKLFEGSADGVT